MKNMSERGTEYTVMILLRIICSGGFLNICKKIGIVSNTVVIGAYFKDCLVVSPGRYKAKETLPT